MKQMALHFRIDPFVSRFQLIILENNHNLVMHLYTEYLVIE